MAQEDGIWQIQDLIPDLSKARLLFVQKEHLSDQCQAGAAIGFPLSFYSVRKSISLMISIPSTEAVEFVFIARMTFL